MSKVNPEILRWARETAGLTRMEAAKKLSIHHAFGMEAVDRLAALETGSVEPTRPMLVRMAKQYRRPLLAFYLSTPPKQGDRGADFRVLPGERSAAEKGILDALVRDVQARQSIVRAVLEEEDEPEPLAFIGRRKIADGVQAVLATLHDLLDVDREAYRAQLGPGPAFELLRNSAERAGVFVLLKGDLGNYHTAMDTEIFRGFSIADQIAPFVVVNDQDARPAWSFTLLHELVHLILGQTGVSGARAENQIEQFCNDVAGQFLLPDEELQHLNFHSDSVATHIGEFATDRNLSRALVAYKAYRSRVIEKSTYDQLSSLFRSQWYKERSVSRERGNDGGPSYYVVRRHRIGRALIGLVDRMMKAGTLTTSKAAMVLGVKPGKVGRLLASTGSP